MNERTVQPIGSVRASDNGVLPKVIAPERAENTSAREHSVPEADRSMKQTEAEKEKTNHLSNIAIHFNVDDETNRLIVVVTERESGRVLRTIPASEFEKLHAGDLLKLTA